MQIDRDALIARRQALPLTQAELAERVGITENSVWLIENGRVTRPRPSTLRSLAKALNVRVEDITRPVERAS